MLANLHDVPMPATRQGYDLARTTDDNRKHWAEADNLAAVSSATPGVRTLLRLRCRYECLNNGYARGLVKTLAGDVVGTGPRLQLHTASGDLNTLVESEWREWSDCVGLAQTLRLMEETRRRDGEVFAIFRRNRQAEEVGLPSVDLRLFEGDQVAHPWGLSAYGNATGDDGIDCDAAGDVTGYHVLRSHPGDQRWLIDRMRADVLSPRDVVHWFQRERPGQLRGVPELACVMPLFAYLRRMDLATLAREEVAASLAAVLETDAPPDEGDEWEPFEAFAIRRGMMMSVPAGARLKQFDTNRPGASHGAFVDTILRAIGRACDVPFGIVAGDSSKYNYSSARLDHLIYDQRRKNDKDAFRTCVLDRLFARFWGELQLIYPAVMVLAGGSRRLPQRSWHFDARPSIDPLKEASADETNLANSTDTETSICAAAGRDIEDVYRERAKERELRAKYGLPEPRYLTAPKPVVGRPASVEEVAVNA